jgi:DNA-directed RNA polymerase specialized sigma24 family protein
MSARGPGALFPSTHWTRLLAARKDPAAQRAVFAELVAPRWKPLYVLARQHRLSKEAAEDAVQSFLERLVADDGGPALVERLDPAKGTLRAYLKTAFRRHLQNLAAGERASKRGGGRPARDLDELEALIAAPELNPEAQFERAWAASVFAAALAALEAEFAAGVRRGPFAVLAELFAFGSTASYDELAERHQMSVSQLKAFVHRSKLRFRTLLREQVQATLGAGEDLDREVRRLLAEVTS